MKGSDSWLVAEPEQADQSHGLSLPRLRTGGAVGAGNRFDLAGVAWATGR